MRQRIMIGMTLMLGPDLLIADEPTSALDVALQDQIVGLLADLQEQTGTTIIIVSHDLGMIGTAADDVMVMYAGEVMEIAPVDRIFSDPLHPYTRALLDVRPGRKARDRPLPTIPGRVPSAAEPIVGCAFAGRCPHTRSVCLMQPPGVVDKAGRQVRCHIHHPESGWSRDTPVDIGGALAQD